MDDKRQLLTFLNIAKRKLFIEHFSRYIHVGFLIAGIVAVMIIFSARIFVILHVMEKLLWISGVIFLATIIISLLKKPTNQLAANLFDEYVKEDRIKSALTFLEDDSAICHLQRRDALAHMKRQIPEIEARKVTIFQWKRGFIILILLAITTISLLVPNDVMKTAQQQEVDEKIAEETKEDIEKLMTEKEKVKEQLKELKEETKNLKKSEELLAKLLAKEASLEEKKQIAKNDEQKLQNLSQAMSDFEELSKALNQADSEKMRKALEELMEKLPTLSEQQLKQLENMVSEVTGKKIYSMTELTDEQLEELLASLETQLDKLIASANSLNQIASLQNQVQQLATSLNQNMVNAGISNSNQIAFASQNPTNQNQGQSGQNQNPNSQGQNGNQNGQGQGQGNGAGNGAGQGTGNGSGQGQGTGAGIGTGSGAGSGTGAGLGQGSRELTIPEKISGNENIETDSGKLGEGSSKQQIAPEAPVLKGTVRPYEEVYGKYEQNYRESVEKMDLPAYLEDVVKDYFSELDPGGE